jgi:hypothetical protein
MNSGGCGLFAFAMSRAFDNILCVELKDAQNNLHYAVGNPYTEVFDSQDRYLLQSGRYIFERTLTSGEMAIILITEKWNWSFFHEYNDVIWDAYEDVLKLINTIKNRRDD